MSITEEWEKEAYKKAKEYADAIRNNSQYLVDNITTSRDNTLGQLQKQQDNALYNLNTNRGVINQSAADNSRQANIARLLALKSNQQYMNRAGLGTQGIVGSQVNSINNNYNSNLASILNQKQSDLRNLDKEKNNLITTYDTNRLNLENEYGNNIANMQAQIDDKALSQHNNIYSNVMNLKQTDYNLQKDLEQQEYDRQQAEIARQESIRQYNENIAYQKQQDAIANAQKWKQLQLQEQEKEQEKEENFAYASPGYLAIDEELQKMNSSKTFGGIAVNKIMAQALINNAYRNGKITDAELDDLFDRYGLD